MTHLQYMPGDPRLVDLLVYELKSKGIFDQFRKDCISDVDTKPAYQNLRQRVESSVSSFLSRQSWKPDLNKNQLREKLRKHLLDGNYLEQGVERIVDQVVNPKVASVFIPQVEDLVYNYLGIVRKRPDPETNEDAVATLLPKDLEAVSPGSVHSNEDKDNDVTVTMDIDEPTVETVDNDKNVSCTDTVDMCVFDSDTSIDKSCIPLPDEILPENIPQPENSPPKIDLDKIELPKEPENVSLTKSDDDTQKTDKDYFKPTDDDDSSSDASLTRNMSPLTPIRNLNSENSCDAQQAFENDSDSKQEDKKEPCSFRFALDNKTDDVEEKTEKKDTEQANLAFQFNNQVNIKPFNTPMYDDSSNSNNLQIDYESDANSKTNVENKIPENENSEDVKKEKKEERKSSHKSSHRSRDSQRHSSSRDKRSDSKYSTSRDSSRNDKDKKSKSDSKSKSSHRERERSKDRSERKDSRDSSKHRSSHKSSNSKDSKSHKSSSQRSSNSKQDEKKSSSQKDRNDKSSDRSKDRSKDKKDSKSSSHRSDKDRKSNSHKSEKDKNDDKNKKKDKKDVDDHYSLSGRGNTNRRSTDRDSNDGSSSSKGSHPPSSKSSESKKETKGSTSKSDNTSYSGDSTSPSDKENIKTIESDTLKNFKPAVHVDNHLELPIAPVPRLPFVPDVTIKKPKFAANLEEAKRMMKMRRFLDEEQQRMNQEAALLLEFQANVRPSLSQVYSSIPGPELEFACNRNTQDSPDNKSIKDDKPEILSDDDNDEQDFIGFECPKVNGQFDVNDNCDVDKDIKHIEELRNETYEENKPFSQLVNEISEYSRASERIKNINSEKNNDKIHGSNEKLDDKSDSNMESKDDDSDGTIIECNDDRTNLFEVTIITEELSENEDSNKVNDQKSITDSEELFYFAEHEKYDSEIERQKFEMFLKKFVEDNKCINKLYILNCERYAEQILRDLAPDFGDFEVVNYHKNGHLKLPKKEVVKEVDLKDEIVLPIENDFEETRSPLLSPVKSECSFELSSDYAAKLEEMVNKTSRQEVMEIILGSVMESPNKMPKIDYYEESTIFCDSLKRKIEPETNDNKNMHVLTPNKIRKMSESDQITSTTEETDRLITNKVQNTRSKYLGRARRVGLSRPKKTNLPNSPSSDKSVENYEQNAERSPNGKLKAAQRTKIQRYSTTDLYKPKLHYLSRRNNIRP